MSSPLTEAFAERMQSVGGRISYTTAEGLAETLGGLVERDRPVLFTPELRDLARQLRDAGHEAYVGTREGVAEQTEAAFEGVLERAGTGVSGSLLGISSTGSIAVGPGGGNGGLLIAFPPHSVIILQADSLRKNLAEALPEVERRFDELDGEAVFVSGPSRTADIEMMSVVGVHGPIGLDVIIVDGKEA
ncbi:MAG TPA: LUD domain-containing protein [Thermoleophilia bacterium]|nr:LUD domain-containing protein [Thermoleophilia bacterium]